MLALYDVNVHIRRVPSKSNPADLPSRGQPPPRACTSAVKPSFKKVLEAFNQISPFA